MQLFYHPQIDPKAKEMVFDKTESHHMVKVLRYHVGQKITVTNGVGTIFEAELTLTSPKKCTALILSSHTQALPKYRIHVGIAPTKNIDRFEWFVEKATEMGVASITPIICAHSERKTIKHDRIEKRVDAATKQSLSAYRPMIHPLMRFSDFLEQNESAEHKFIAHCHQDDMPHLLTKAPVHKSYTVLIGPEGDFSPSEIQQALEQNYIQISLGTQRLRTETAGIAAVHTLNLRQITGQD